MGNDENSGAESGVVVGASVAMTAKSTAASLGKGRASFCSDK